MKKDGIGLHLEDNDSRFFLVFEFLGLRTMRPLVSMFLSSDKEWKRTTKAACVHLSKRRLGLLYAVSATDESTTRSTVCSVHSS